MLSRLGFATLRFLNSEVMDNLDGVLETLRSTLAILLDRWAGSTTPSPSSE
ncbi:DUF559 domain-containing protein [Sphingobium lignivorans]|uniref:Very-short-patch-repair endonuclease n=1 Tax=Sphingobium lignivorans TaxID=2735886 RepID=A0ABR6NCZ5_9SPHN|nr:DUF559 domain-containing protein [Sphingobium lignivorans]MBB5985141.1 very-short-patch-repair endonuclease [Sphingobium lignivorans]